VREKESKLENVREVKGSRIEDAAAYMESHKVGARRVRTPGTILDRDAESKTQAIQQFKAIKAARRSTKKEQEAGSLEGYDQGLENETGIPFYVDECLYMSVRQTRRCCN